MINLAKSTISTYASFQEALRETSPTTPNLDRTFREKKSPDEGDFTVLLELNKNYFIECSPIWFPSESSTSAQKPISPIADFGVMIFPPADSTRLK